MLMIASAASSSRVAPRAGAWIETTCDAGTCASRRGRPPRGGVDRNARTSGEGAHAFLDWLTVVARDEIEVRWPHVEKVAQALCANGL